jgi:hypothetical protein
VSSFNYEALQLKSSSLWSVVRQARLRRVGEYFGCFVGIPVGIDGYRLVKDDKYQKLGRRVRFRPWAPFYISNIYIGVQLRQLIRKGRPLVYTSTAEWQHLVMFNWLTKRRALVLAEADEFMEFYGDCDYAEARKEMRAARGHGDSQQ